MSWQPVPEWAARFLNNTVVAEYLRFPFKAVHDFVGAPLAVTMIYVFMVYATFMHTKSVFAAGVVSLLLATTVIVMLPELRLISYIALAFGTAAVIYALARKVA